jgi:hypothetical protein
MEVACDDQWDQPCMLLTTLSYREWRVLKLHYGLWDGSGFNELGDVQVSPVSASGR